MGDQEFRLIELDMGMEEAYREMEADLEYRPDKRYRARDEPWPAYVRRIQCRGLRNRLRHLVRTLSAKIKERRDWKHLDELISYGENPPPHLKPPRPTYVRSRAFWLVDENGRILGGSEVRERETPFLIYEGGQLGADIRPSERRRGHGTRILRLTLEKARKMGLKRVMLSCEPATPSVKLILRAGGVFENTVISHRGIAKARYWVDLKNWPESSARLRTRPPHA